MRWPIGIAIGFLVLFVFDFCFAWVAITGAEPSVPSYATAKR